jgi:hypothetical protein
VISLRDASAGGWPDALANERCRCRSTPDHVRRRPFASKPGMVGSRPDDQTDVAAICPLFGAGVRAYRQRRTPRDDMAAVIAHRASISRRWEAWGRYSPNASRGRRSLPTGPWPEALYALGIVRFPWWSSSTATVAIQRDSRDKWRIKSRGTVVFPVWIYVVPAVNNQPTRP